MILLCDILVEAIGLVGSLDDAVNLLSGQVLPVPLLEPIWQGILLFPLLRQLLLLETFGVVLCLRPSVASSTATSIFLRRLVGLILDVKTCSFLDG